MAAGGPGAGAGVAAGVGVGVTAGTGTTITGMGPVASGVLGWVGSSSVIVWHDAAHTPNTTIAISLRTIGGLL